MSFQAYIDNIRAQTGKTPEDFKALAAQKGLLAPDTKAKQVIDWLKEDFGLGYGHAMAIYGTLHSGEAPELGIEERVAKHFGGAKSVWRKPYDALMKEVGAFGPGISFATTDSYISLLKDGKKFAVIAVSGQRLDVGIKLKGVEPQGRLAESGKWNAMVTHRVQINDPEKIDEELIEWLRRAYGSA
jgi:predicted transport protein